MKNCSNTEAVVFFNNNYKLSMLDRKGYIEIF